MAKKKELKTLQPLKVKASSGITMADLLAKSAKKVMGFTSGQKVRGKILSIGGKTVVLDIGGKSEGVVAEEAFSESREFIKKLSL